MKKTKRKLRSCGFTLIELLVVIGIIMLLIGMLVPGMQMIKKQARSLRQKAVFHGIEIGIGFFRNDEGEYPPSKRKFGMSGVVSGAQHLAEAMVGRDKQGFEPSTQWYAPIDQAGSSDLYDYTLDSSKNRRRDIYLELKDASLHVLSELYDNTGSCYSGMWDDTNKPPAPVLVDIFQHKEITDVNGKKVKVGTPILYYKANRKSKSFKEDPPLDPDVVPYDRRMYNYQDNDMILKLGSLVKNDSPPPDLAPHRFASDFTDGVKNFYEFITNPGQVTTAGGTTFYKPYNASEFILISAGWDGIFGTRDDLTNFNY